MSILRRITKFVAGAGEVLRAFRLPRNSSDDPLARAIGDVIELPKQFLLHHSMMEKMHGKFFIADPKVFNSFPGF